MSIERLPFKRAKQRFNTDAINKLRTVLDGNWGPRNTSGELADAFANLGAFNARFLTSAFRKIFFGTSTDNFSIEEDSSDIIIKRNGAEYLKMDGNRGTISTAGADPGAYGISRSSSSGSYSTTSTSYADVTNLECDLTTVGRPVFGYLTAGSSLGYIQVSRTTATDMTRGFIQILRGSTVIAEHRIGFQVEQNGSGDKRLHVPPGTISFFDDGVLDSPGTYTYKVQAKSDSGETVILEECILEIMEWI